MNSLTDQDPRAPEGARGHESGGQFIGPTTVVRYGRIDPRGGWSVLISRPRVDVDRFGKTCSFLRRPSLV